MNIELKIKVTLIRRLRNCCLTSMQSQFISLILDCDVPDELIYYVYVSTDDQIVADIARGIPIAIKLINLKPNWES